MDTAGLERLVYAYDMIFYNEPGKATRPTQRKLASIIDLTFTTLNIGALNMWVIDNELIAHSDYEVEVYDLVDPNGEIQSMGSS